VYSADLVEHQGKRKAAIKGGSAVEKGIPPEALFLAEKKGEER